jgi:hypothetical protein
VRFKANPGQIVCKTLSQKHSTQKSAVERLKVIVLNSKLSTVKKKKKNK